MYQPGGGYDYLQKRQSAIFFIRKAGCQERAGEFSVEKVRSIASSHLEVAFSQHIACRNFATLQREIRTDALSTFMADARFATKR
jgi:hypothetical protein